MSVPITLCLLALLDGAFAGFRASAGNDARLPDRQTNVAAALWGVGVGAAGLVAIAVVTLSFLIRSPNRPTHFDEFLEAGSRMLVFYIPMAVITLVAVALHVLVRDHEVSAAAMTLVLGPVTLVRPLVIGVGGLAAGLTVPTLHVWSGAATAATVTIAVGPVVRRLRFTTRDTS